MNDIVLYKSSPKHSSSLSSSHTSSSRPFDLLKHVPEESLWAANFFKSTTNRTYLTSLKQFCHFLQIQHIDELRDVNPAHITAFRDHLLDLKLSPQTINTRLSALSSLFNELLSKQIVRFNPVTGVKRMREEYDRVKSICLLKEDVRRMIHSVPSDSLNGLRDKAILLILFHTGCRIGEISRLKVKDLFIEKGHTVLDFSIKGGRRNRVPIPLTVDQAIHQYLSLMWHQDFPDAPLFLSARASHISASDRLKPLSERALLNIWNKYKTVDNSTPHSARTTFISTAYDNKVDSHDIQQTVGHRDSRTTKKYDHSDFSYTKSATYKVWYD